MPKGGKPSIINSPDGAEFIAFLRVQFLRKTRTAQNCMKYEELNKWIDEMSLMECNQTCCVVT